MSAGAFAQTASTQGGVPPAYPGAWNGDIASALYADQHTLRTQGEVKTNRFARRHRGVATTSMTKRPEHHNRCSGLAMYKPRSAAKRSGPFHCSLSYGRPRQVKYWPPFAVSVEPVMKPASSDARKTTQRAISAASPSRPTGIWAMMPSRTFSGTAITMSVAM